MYCPTLGGALTTFALGRWARTSRGRSRCRPRSHPHLHPYAHQVYLSVFSSRATSFEARAPGTHTPQSRRARHTAARRPPPPKEPPRWSASDHQRMSTRRGGYRVRPRVIGLQIVEPNKLLQLEVCDLALELPRVCQGERSTPCDLVPSTRTPPRPVGPLGSILTADPCMYCTGRWVLSSVWS